MKLLQILRERYQDYLERDKESAKKRLASAFQEYLHDFPEKDRLIHQLQLGTQLKEQVQELKHHLGIELQHLDEEQKSGQEIIDDLKRIRQELTTPYQKAEHLLQRLNDILSNQVLTLNNLVSKYPDLPKTHLIQHLHESLWVEKELNQRIKELNETEPLF